MNHPPSLSHGSPAALSTLSSASNGKLTNCSCCSLLLMLGQDAKLASLTAAFSEQGAEIKAVNARLDVVVDELSKLRGELKNLIKVLSSGKYSPSTFCMP